MPDAPDDQRTVIDLLNRIPVAEGGSGEQLGDRVVSIICSDELYQGILRFEDSLEDLHGVTRTTSAQGGLRVARQGSLNAHLRRWQQRP